MRTSIRTLLLICTTANACVRAVTVPPPTVDELGCAVPPPTVFTKVGTTIEIARATTRRTDMSGAKAALTPEVVTLASQANLDEQVLRYLDCRALKAFSHEDAQWFTELTAFARTRPSPDQMITWQREHPSPAELRRRKSEEPKGALGPQVDKHSSVNLPPNNVPAASDPGTTGPTSVKDLGPLRVTVVSAQIVTLSAQELCKNASGDTVFCSSLSQSRSHTSIHINLALTNRDGNKTMYVAMNATNQRRGDGYNVVYGPSGTFANCGLGIGVRSSLVDSDGTVWESAGVTGIGTVGVGCVNGDGDPADIARALSRQEGLNGGQLPIRAQYAYGTPSTIDPGQTTSISLTYTLDGSTRVSKTHLDFVQLSSEFVVGIAQAGGRASYSLRHLTIERVNLKPQ